MKVMFGWSVPMVTEVVHRQLSAVDDGALCGRATFDS